MERTTTQTPRSFGFFHGMPYTYCFVRGWRTPSARQATLAQSVERLTRNEQVVSSILTSGSTALGWFVRLGFCIWSCGWRFPTACSQAVCNIARVAELVDAQDLGSCVLDVWVRVPSRAQSRDSPLLAVVFLPHFSAIVCSVPLSVRLLRSYALTSRQTYTDCRSSYVWREKGWQSLTKRTLSSTYAERRYKQQRITAVATTAARQLRPRYGHQRPPSQGDVPLREDSETVSKARRESCLPYLRQSACC